MNVVVVGAGPGGLACAIALRQAGIGVTVLERQRVLEPVGTGLGVWPAALRALDVIGLGERVRETGVAQHRMRAARWDGRHAITGRSPARGEPVVLISRAALSGMLADALPDGVLRLGTAVTDPRGLDAEVVVGADGVRSAVRAAVFGPRTQVRRTGAVVWRGIVDGSVPVSMEIRGPGKKFGITQVEGGRTNWYAAAAGAPLCADPDRALAVLRAEFDGWAEPVAGLLRRIDATRVLHHHIDYLAPSLPSFVRGTVALLGDAAHAMPPDLGQGACQAIRDGVALGRCLAASDHPITALADYDAIRRHRSQRVAFLARLVNRLTLSRVSSRTVSSSRKIVSG